MNNNLDLRDTDQLITEADELIEQIHADTQEYMEDEYRLQFELQTQKLKKIKSELQEKIAEDNSYVEGPVAEGMHKGIEDVMTAIKDLKAKMSRPLLKVS